MSIEIISGNASLLISAISTPIENWLVCIMLLSEFIFKGSILLVDIEIIIFMKIISDIYVRIAIKVYIGNRDAQAITDDGTIDP